MSVGESHERKHNFVPEKSLRGAGAWPARQNQKCLNNLKIFFFIFLLIPWSGGPNVP